MSIPDGDTQGVQIVFNRNWTERFARNYEIHRVRSFFRRRVKLTYYVTIQRRRVNKNVGSRSRVHLADNGLT